MDSVSSMAVSYYRFHQANTRQTRRVGDVLSRDVAVKPRLEGGASEDPPVSSTIALKDRH